MSPCRNISSRYFLVVGAETELETFDEKHYVNCYFPTYEEKRLFLYKIERCPRQQPNQTHLKRDCGFQTTIVLQKEILLICKAEKRTI